MSKITKTVKDPIKVKESQEEQERSLEELRQSLVKHTFSFATTNYRDLTIALRREKQMLDRAMSLGFRGIEMYRTEQQHALNLAVSKAAKPEIDRLKAKVAATREQYMTPLDHFKERLAQHDWYWPFSDDASVARSASARENELQREAREHGTEWQLAFNEASMKHRIRESPSPRKQSVGSL